MKRALDIAVGGVLLILMTPVMVIAFAGSALCLRAWPFFSQTRVGHKGREFRFVKVRTLPTSTPQYADKYALRSYDVPRFTSMLRRTHLDELPQLFHVLVGQMSLVGPRPEMPHLHATLDREFAAARGSMRPGCTGLWQVSDRRGGLIGESPEFDYYYVVNHSLRLDLWILARTMRQMLPFTRTAPVAYTDLPIGDREVAPAPVTVRSS